LFIFVSDHLAREEEDEEREPTHLINLLSNINKPNLLHPRLPSIRRVHILAKLLRRSVHVLYSFKKALRLEMCLVVRVRVDVDRRNLKVPAGLQVLERFLEEVVVVADEALELAPVDVVEGLAVGPGEFEVVDFEAAVWGDPGWFIELV
jgi:hypothetical protein